jgi:hypothetical protein
MKPTQRPSTPSSSLDGPSAMSNDNDVGAIGANGPPPSHHGNHQTNNFGQSVYQQSAHHRVHQHPEQAHTPYHPFDFAWSHTSPPHDQGGCYFSERAHAPYHPPYFSYTYWAPPVNTGNHNITLYPTKHQTDYQNSVITYPPSVQPSHTLGNSFIHQL